MLSNSDQTKEILAERLTYLEYLEKNEQQLIQHAVKKKIQKKKEKEKEVETKVK